MSELLHHPETLEDMSVKMRALGLPDATNRIAGIVLGLAEGKTAE